MKKYLFFVSSLLFAVMFIGCKGTTSEKTTDPIWGMWQKLSEEGTRLSDSLQTVFSEKVPDDLKYELMFCEDSTGFDFRNDTVFQLCKWLRNDSLITFSWTIAGNDAPHVCAPSQLYVIRLTDDTLVVRDRAADGSHDIVSTYLRERDGMVAE